MTANSCHIFSCNTSTDSGLLEAWQELVIMVSRHFPHLVLFHFHVFIISVSATLCSLPYFTLTFGADSLIVQSLRPCMFGLVRNANTTKGQKSLLVALANRRRVVGLTSPNFSGSMVYAPVMEYLSTI